MQYEISPLWLLFLHQFQDEGVKEAMNLIPRGSPCEGGPGQDITSADRMKVDQFFASASVSVVGEADTAIDAVGTNTKHNAMEILENQAETIGVGAANVVAAAKDAALLHMPGMMHRGSTSQQAISSPRKIGRTLQMYSVDDEATIEALGKQVCKEQH